jgi:Flp pilus assembly protein TadD
MTCYKVILSASEIKKAPSPPVEIAGALERLAREAAHDAKTPSDGMRKKDKSMRYVGEGRRLARGALITAAAMAFAGFGQPGVQVSAAWAKDAQPYVDKAQGYIAKGNFSAAEIELRNAEREAPKDPHIRALLAQVYLKRGDFKNAEREARAARDLNGPEAEYILTLADAMMRQGKFADIASEIKPGDRPPELESKIRVVLGVAANALRDPAKAEALLREAVSLDPKAASAKLALA